MRERFLALSEKVPTRLVVRTLSERAIPGPGRDRIMVAGGWRRNAETLRKRNEGPSKQKQPRLGVEYATRKGWNP